MSQTKNENPVVPLIIKKKVTKDYIVKNPIEEQEELEREELSDEELDNKKSSKIDKKKRKLEIVEDEAQEEESEDDNKSKKKKKKSSKKKKSTKNKLDKDIEEEEKEEEEEQPINKSKSKSKSKSKNKTKSQTEEEIQQEEEEIERDIQDDEFNEDEELEKVFKPSSKKSKKKSKKSPNSTQNQDEDIHEQSVRTETPETTVSSNKRNPRGMPRDKDLESEGTNSVYGDDESIDLEYEELKKTNKTNVNTKTTTTTTAKTSKFKPNISKTNALKISKPKVRGNIEDRYEEVSPLDVGKFTLGQLTKKRIIGATMQSTIEREALRQTQKTQLHHFSQQQRANTSNNNSGTYGYDNNNNNIDNENDSAEVEFVDGKLVIKQAFSGSDASQQPHNYTVFYEGQNHITNRSYSKKPISKKWTQEETDLFFVLLRTYGTDFSTLESLMPDRTRSQIRCKFKKEERDNPNILDDILHQKIDINIEEFSKQNEVAKVKRKVIEENQRQQSLIESLDPNATESELNELSAQMNSEKQSAFLSSLQKQSGANTTGSSEEVIMETDQYQQHSVEQQPIDYDSYNFQNDDYGTGDYDY